MLLGVNNSVFEDVDANVGGIATTRAYVPPNGDFSTWPGQSAGKIKPGVVGVLSLRPNLVDVVSGKLDGALNAYMNQCPAETMLTLWHECNLPMHKLSASEYKAAMLHLLELRNEGNFEVAIGCIFSTYPVTYENETIEPWYPTRYMDFFALDGYKRHANETPELIFAPSFDLLTHSDMYITETNTHIGPQASWFDDVATFAEQYALKGVAGWWGLPGGKYGDLAYDPSDAALNAALASIATRHDEFI